MVPVMAPLLLVLLLPVPTLLIPPTAVHLGAELRGQRSEQDSIKVVISEGCSSPGDFPGQEGKEIDLSPGSPLVLTHKIKLVPSGLGSGSGSGSGSCGCEADFAALRERVEHLEMELSALKQKCGGTDGTCSSSKESKGPDYSVKPDPDQCLNECSDQGRCEDGRCVCFDGFTGPDCSRADCLGNCSSRGRCVDGRCLCHPGFTGPDCSTKQCPDNCNHRGRCVAGRCVCDSGFSGWDCSEDASCPGNCNDAGRCVNGRCVCDDGFTANDCSQKTCPNGCSHRGQCVDGRCVCEAGFSGPSCASRGCPGNCSGRGRCVQGGCVCRRGFWGPDCSQCQGGRTGPHCDTVSVLSGVSQLLPQNVTDSSVTLIWTPPDIPYETYQLSFSSQQKEGDQVIQAQLDGTLDSFTQTGLAAGQRYTVSIVGQLGGRRGAQTTNTFTTLVSGPSNLHVVKTTSTSAVVQWEESRGEIDRYLLTVTPSDGEGRSQEITVPFGQNSAHIQQLEAGRWYDVQLVAEGSRSRSEPATVRALPGVTVARGTVAAFPLQVRQAPDTIGDPNRQAIRNGTETEDRDKVPLTPGRRTLISRARATNGTRLNMAGKPKPSGPSHAVPTGIRRPALKNHSAGAVRTRQAESEQSRVGDSTSPDSKSRDDPTPAAPETETGTNRQSSSERTTGPKEQADVGAESRGKDTDTATAEPSSPTGTPEKKCLNRMKVTHLRLPLKDRRGAAMLNSEPGAPSSGDLDPLHKLLVDTFESLNVTTFSVHLSKASNLSHDEKTVKKQLLGGLIPLPSFSSSSLLPSGSEPSSSESAESSSSSPSNPDSSSSLLNSQSSSSPSIPGNSDSPGNELKVDDSRRRTDRKPPSLSGEGRLPYFRRTLPPKRGSERRPHPHFYSFHNRTSQQTRVPLHLPPHLNPEIQNESKTSPSDSTKSPSDEVVASVIYTSNKDMMATSTPSGVKQKDRELFPVRRPSPKGGYPRNPSLRVGPPQNRTLPNRQPHAHPSQPLHPEIMKQKVSLSVSASPLISAGSRPSETKENEGTIGGRVPADFNQSLGERTPPSYHPYRRTAFFRRPQLHGGSAQNRTGLSFLQRGPIRKPNPGSRVNIGKRVDPEGRDALSENQTGEQNVLRMAEKNQIRLTAEQDSPTNAEKNSLTARGRQPDELQHDYNKETITTKVQTASQTGPGPSRPVIPPTTPGKPFSHTDEHDSGIRSETKALGQEHNERTVATGSSALTDSLVPEEATDRTVEGWATRREPHSGGLKPSRTGPDEFGQGGDEDSATASTDGHRKDPTVGGRAMLKNENSKPLRPFSPPKREPSAKTMIEKTQTFSQNKRVTPEKVSLDKGGHEESFPNVNLRKNTGTVVRGRPTPNPPASRPSSPVDRKPLTRTGQDPTPIKRQYSRVTAATGALHFEDNKETTGEASADVGEITGRLPTQVRTEERSSSTGSHDTGGRSESSTSDTRDNKETISDENVVTAKSPGNTIMDRPTLQEPSSRLVRPAAPPRRVPPPPRTEERNTQRGGHDSASRPEASVRDVNQENTPEEIVDVGQSPDSTSVERNSKPSTPPQRRPATARKQEHSSRIDSPVRPETSFFDKVEIEEMIPEGNIEAGNTSGSRAKGHPAVRKPDSKPVSPSTKQMRPVGHDTRVRLESNRLTEKTRNETTASSPNTPEHISTSSVAGAQATLTRADSRASRPDPAARPKKPTAGLLHIPTRHRDVPRLDRTGRLLGGGTTTSRASPGSVGGVIREPLDFVGVTNRTAEGFMLVWEAPEGKFKNFVVTQDKAEKDGEDPQRERKEESGYDSNAEKEKSQPSKHDNRVPEGSVGKDPSIRTGSGSDQSFRTVVPGSARYFQFQDLLPKTEYSLTLLGKGPGLLSKLHKLVISTGPEPPTNIVFSDVTENSVTVSWTKPRNPVSGFRVTYTHADEGEPVSVSVDSENSSLGLSRLSPGSSYEVAVVSTVALEESDAIRDFVTTRPDPPTDLRAVNVSESSALLLWRPALAAVDKYTIVYGAGTDSELRITVSGNAAEQQLDGLEASSTYTVTISSQLGRLESSPTSTHFTTTGGSGNDGGESLDLRASSVSPRTATLSWKPPSQPVDGYRLRYRTDRQEVKEILVDASLNQFNLSRLHPGSSYSVHLQAEPQVGGATSGSSTHFTTGWLRFPFPSDCSQELLNGILSSGEVEIFPGGEAEPSVAVYCDMETDGGGWTVFQRRKDGSQDFFRGWKDYVRGFGDVNGEFWLGLDSLQNLTAMVPMTLRVDLRAAGDAAFAQYSTFQVGKKNYKLTVGGYSGTAGDSLGYHNNRIFSTRDRDPATFITRCAMSYRGGWWYKNCYQANLNGLYGVSIRHQGVVWTSWKGNEFSIPFTEMKMRPREFRPPARG